MFHFSLTSMEIKGRVISKITKQNGTKIEGHIWKSGPTVGGYLSRQDEVNPNQANFSVSSHGERNVQTRFNFTKL